MLKKYEQEIVTKDMKTQIGV